MFENRNLKLDLFALALLVLIIFVTVSLFTYNAADPIGELVSPLNRIYQQDVLVYPMGDKVTNACGWWGALSADLLLNGLGVGSYFLLLSLAIVDGVLLCRREIGSPVWRLTGWLAALFGFTTLVSILAPGLSPGPVIGSGGYLGMLGRGLLETHLAFAGTLIFAGSLLLGGVLMCTEYVLIRAGIASFLAAGRAANRGREIVKQRRKAAVRRRTDIKNDEIELAVAEAEAEGAEAEEFEEEEQKQELSVRVRGKSVEAEAEAEEEEVDEDEGELDDDDEEEFDEEEIEEEAVSTPDPVVKKRERSKSGGVSSKPHFQVKKSFGQEEREEVMSSLDAASVEDPGEYELPDIDLLIEADDVCFDEQVTEVRRKARILEKTFANFGFKVKVVEIETGPVIAQYEVELEAGLRLSKITGLADDLAIALRVPSVRIVAPIPGKNTVGIEVPNEARQVVRLREVIDETNGKAGKMNIPLFLGKDVSGNPLTVDLASLPHLLIAGRTGTGKSVCLNAIISSILMTKKPDEVRLLLIDPKMVELSGYGRLPHLMHPVVTDMRKAEAILAWAVEKMEERYSMLARAGVRHISSYNQLSEEELRRRMKPESEVEFEAIPNHLPFVVIVADEMADLMMTAGKEVEQHIIRLAQKSRAVGIHLILATQKPTVDVITGLIKSNLPARISFQVASRTDSRVVLDEMGADRLLGNGDMLFLWPGTSSLLRGQGTYLSDEEIDRVVDSVSTGEQNFVNELVNLKIENEEEQSDGPGQLKRRDDLYEGAVDVVVREGRGSVSLLQRSLGVGYGRAARLIDYMAEDGIVGPYAGSQAREVLISVSDWEAMQNGGSAEPEAPPVQPATPPRKRRNKVTPGTDWDDSDGNDDNRSDAPATGRGSKKAETYDVFDEHEEEEDAEAVGEETEYEEDDYAEEADYDEGEEYEYEEDEYEAESA